MSRALVVAVLLIGCHASNGIGDGMQDSDAGSHDLAIGDLAAGGDLGSAFDLAVAPPSCTGKTISASGGLDFDIKVVTLSGKLTINGAPGSGYVQLTSARSPTPALANIPMAGSYSVNLAPDTYDISLQNKGRIKSGVVVTSSTTLDLDVTTVEVGGTVTANGAALAKDEGSVTFTGADGTPIAFEVRNGGYGGTLVPGTYDIGWAPDASCSATPCAAGIVKKAVAVTATGSIDLDLPMVTVSGNISINGAARNISDGGGPFFTLKDGGTALVTLANGVVNYKVNVLAGSYDIGWQGAPDACGHSPCNRGVFMPGVSLTSSQPLDLPVPMISLSGAVTINQVGAGDTGCFGVTFGDLRVPEDVSGGYQVNLLPGTYDVGWSPKGQCSGAPWNVTTLLPKKALTASGKLDLDVPMVTVSGRVSVNGDFGATTNGGSGTFTASGAPPLAVEFFREYTVNLTPGVYDIGWTPSMSSCSQEPCNAARLRSNVLLTSTQTLDVDLPMITMSGNVTANGNALMPLNSVPAIELQSVTGDVPAVVRLDTMPYVVNLTPGAFTAKYVPDRGSCNGTGLPCSEEVLIDCK